MQHQRHIRVGFGTMRLRSSGVGGDLQFVLGIQADFEIVIDDREWLREPGFPVVELALAARYWLRNGGDLMFDCKRTGVSFLWVCRTESGYLLGAASQKFRIEAPLPCEPVLHAFREFTGAVVEAAHRDLDVDLEPILHRWSTSPTITQT